jgi:hypothetical protein
MLYSIAGFYDPTKLKVDIPFVGLQQENATLALFLGLLKLFVLKSSKYEAKEVLQIEEK